MSKESIRTVSCAALTVAALVVVNVSFAKNGRDYAAQYWIEKATPAGSNVHVSLRLQLTNYGDQPLQGAQVTMKDPMNPMKDHGTFASPVSIEKRATKELKGDFTVPKQEYDLWLRGATPEFVVVQTVQGHRLEHHVDVLLMGVQQ